MNVLFYESVFEFEIDFLGFQYSVILNLPSILPGYDVRRRESEKRSQNKINRINLSLAWA